MDSGSDLEWLESLGDHQGSQIRSTDADVDHIGDGFARVAFPFAWNDIISWLYGNYQLLNQFVPPNVPTTCTEIQNTVQVHHYMIVPPVNFDTDFLYEFKKILLQNLVF